MTERVSLNRLDLTFPRIEQEELLDVGEGSLEEAAKNLAEMQRINDWLGGTRALTLHLLPRIEAHPGTVTLLDLGTGGGGLLRTLAGWGRKKNKSMRLVGVDWAARNLRLAQRSSGGQEVPTGEIRLLQADARCLPLAPGEVDYVVSSLFLHHLTPDAVISVLRQANRLARHGVIMSDLVRGRMPYLAFKLIQPVFARSRLTRHDGTLSIRRAYTPAELAELANQAGLTSARLFNHFPWRMTLVVDK